MKLATHDGNLIGNIQNNKTFKIANSKKAFMMLSDQLYSDRLGSTIREICVNAYDAHKEAGIEDEPFLITLPSNHSENIIVRDYGFGLTEDQIYNIYTTYFESTKDNTNDYVGALGIGSKSPFSLTRSFYVNSYQSGIKHTYMMHMDNEGLPTVSKLGNVVTDQRNGLEVIIPFTDKEYTITNIIDSIKKWLISFDPYPIIIHNYNVERGDNLNPLKTIDPETGKGVSNKSFEQYVRFNNIIEASNRVIDVTNKDNTITKVLIINNNGYKRYGGTKYYIKYGPIIYPVGSTKLEIKPNKIVDYIEYDLLLEANIGDLDITLSREEIKFTPQTINTITNKINYCISYMEEKLNEIETLVSSSTNTTIVNGNISITSDEIHTIREKIYPSVIFESDNINPLAYELYIGKHFGRQNRKKITIDNIECDLSYTMDKISLMLGNYSYSTALKSDFKVLNLSYKAEYTTKTGKQVKESIICKKENIPDNKYLDSNFRPEIIIDKNNNMKYNIESFYYKRWSSKADELYYFVSEKDIDTDYLIIDKLDYPFEDTKDLKDFPDPKMTKKIICYNYNGENKKLINLFRLTDKILFKYRPESDLLLYPHKDRVYREIKSHELEELKSNINTTKRNVSVIKENSEEKIKVYYAKIDEISRFITGEDIGLKDNYIKNKTTQRLITIENFIKSKKILCDKNSINKSANNVNFGLNSIIGTDYIYEIPDDIILIDESELAKYQQVIENYNKKNNTNYKLKFVFDEIIDVFINSTIKFCKNHNIGASDLYRSLRPLDCNNTYISINNSLYTSSKKQIVLFENFKHSAYSIENCIRCNSKIYGLDSFGITNTITDYIGNVVDISETDFSKIYFYIFKVISNMIDIGLIEKRVNSKNTLLNNIIKNHIILDKYFRFIAININKYIQYYGYSLTRNIDIVYYIKNMVINGSKNENIIKLFSQNNTIILEKTMEEFYISLDNQDKVKRTIKKIIKIINNFNLSEKKRILKDVCDVINDKLYDFRKYGNPLSVFMYKDIQRIIDNINNQHQDVYSDFKLNDIDFIYNLREIYQGLNNTNILINERRFKKEERISIYKMMMNNIKENFISKISKE